MPSITRGQTTDKRNFKRTKFPLPECGEDMYLWLRPISRKEQKAVSVAQIELFTMGARDMKTLSSDELQALADKAEKQSLAFIAMCAVDDKGEPLFSDAADAEANLPEIESSHFADIGRKILEISGMLAKPEKN